MPELVNPPDFFIDFMKYKWHVSYIINCSLTQHSPSELPKGKVLQDILGILLMYLSPQLNTCSGCLAWSNFYDYSISNLFCHVYSFTSYYCTAIQNHFRRILPIKTPSSKEVLKTNQRTVFATLCNNAERSFSYTENNVEF